MSGNFTEVGDLILIIGDFHVPNKSPGLSNCFKQLLRTDKIRHILCTGNLGCSEILQYLQGFTCSLHIVKGDMEYCGKRGTTGNKLSDAVESHNNTNAVLDGNEFPEFHVVTLGELRVGLIHGHQIIPWGSELGLMEWCRYLNCDVLVSGHTHRHSTFESDGKFFINPGSATGAFQPGKFENDNSESCVNPSFMLMAVHGSTALLYAYEQIDNEAQIKLTEFHKQAPSPTVSSSNQENSAKSLMETFNDLSKRLDS